MTTQTTPQTQGHTSPAPGARDTDAALQRKILDTIDKKSFCTLATTSPTGHAHVAGVVYESVEGTLWVHALSTSRKARSIAANGKAAICVPFRRLPVGPPYTIHFQATAEIVRMDSPEVTTLLDAGKLASISGHGALDMEDGCFIAIRPRGTVHSFGPGAKALDLIRDPLNSGARSFQIDEVTR